jgi:2-polyprenyl-6-methoxyphenol hydroxylase-like FAD-dependent oxidoreductase
MEPHVYDVLILGYGPVGQALALMLGRQGRSVAVCERWAERYPLPRAVCIDHEIYRVLTANGMGPVLPTISHKGPKYQWFNAAWEELLVIDWSAESISGGTEVNFVHQPTLEAAISQAASSSPNVVTYLGWEAVSVQQDTRLCHLELKNQAGEAQRLSARYLVGCDGANSTVRRHIGGVQEDRGFEADWLVIDVLLREGVTMEQLKIPAAGQYCNPERPTTIVPAGVRDGKMFRRWEFMRLPGEPVEEMETEARVWELLKPWAGPDEVEVVRSKVYTFRSLLAQTWRQGRLLLAGDAAHVMPPFMGQGMCSGIRDAWNLAWKLDLILDGKASDRLLDTYQAERMPHVSQIIDLSIYLGKMICTADPLEAERRDQAFKMKTVPPPPAFPCLTSGLLRRTAQGSTESIQAGAGLLAPHVSVEGASGKGRLDEAVGLGFVMITTCAEPLQNVSAETLAGLKAIELRCVRLGDQPRDGIYKDLDSRLEPFMREQGWDTMIVRPDFYVYGGAKGEAAATALLGDLLSDLGSEGVCLPLGASMQSRGGN